MDTGLYDDCPGMGENAFFVENNIFHKPGIGQVITRLVW